MRRTSTHALSAIAGHASDDYVSTPTVELLAVLGQITVARLHFPDGGDRIASVGWYGEDYRDDHAGDRLGYVTDEDAIALVIDSYKVTA